MLQEVEESGTEAQEELRSLVRQRESQIDGLARRYDLFLRCPTLNG